MTNRIDRNQNVGQSTSKLPVKAPLPVKGPLMNPTDNEQHHVPARPPQTVQSVVSEVEETHVYVSTGKKRSSSPPPMALPVGAEVSEVQSRPSQLERHGRAECPQSSPVAHEEAKSTESTNRPVKVASASVQTFVLPDGSVIEQDDNQRPMGERLIYGLPSWLVSFIVHLTLLILLALLSLNAGKGPQIVELQLAEAESFDNMRVLDLVIDQELDRVEDSAQLEMAEEDQLSFESEMDLQQAEFADLKSGLDLSASDRNSLEGDGAQLSRGDGKSARFFGAGAVGTKFVFIIDCSGSMDEEYRWDTAKRELRDAVGGLTRKQKYYVFLYNSHAYGMTTKRPKLLPAIKSTRKKTFDWLTQQYPVGDTRPWMAVKAALGMQPDAIFLLSDGELKDETVRLLRRDNRAGAQLSDPRGKRIELSDKIPIHTVFLGKGVGKQTMREIADENNGSFTQVRK